MSLSSKVKELANAMLEDAKKRVLENIQDSKNKLSEYIEAKRKELLESLK